MGVSVDKKGSTMAVLHAMEEQAVMGVWSKHHKQLCCGHVLLVDRLKRLYDTARGCVSVRIPGGDLVHPDEAHMHGA